MPIHSLPHQFRAYQLGVRDVWELAFDSDLYEIAVLAVIVNPLLNLSLVGDGHTAAVDVNVTPPIPVPSEAFSEAPGVSGGVPERHPKDFCGAVG
jgi:hypothetical protein